MCNNNPDKKLFMVPRCLKICKYGTRNKYTGLCPRKYEQEYKKFATRIMQQQVNNYIDDDNYNDDDDDATQPNNTSNNDEQDDEHATDNEQVEDDKGSFFGRFWFNKIKYLVWRTT